MKLESRGLCGLICALLVGLAGMVWAAGTISISTTTLQNTFPGATVSGSSGKFSVTLQSDVGPVTLKDYYGTLTVNLNGHSITGRVNCATAIEGAALTLTYNSAAGSTKDATYPLKLKLTGTGSVVGGRGADATMTTSPGVGGYGIYSAGIYNTSYVTNDVNVVIQGGRGGDNYCGGVGGAGGAGYYCKAKGASYQTTYLYFCNLGTVRGGCGGTGATTGGAGGYGAYFVDSSYSRLSVNSGTIYGGNGGNGSVGGGAGGSSSNQAVGTRVNGTSGGVDTTLFFSTSFPGATVTETEGGGHLVTLGNDLCALNIPDSVGALTIDLNGHSITGKVGQTSPVNGAAIAFKKIGGGTPTALTFMGTGTVKGGDMSGAYQGGYGIYVPTLTAGCSLTLGEGVTVIGGTGGASAGDNYSLSSGAGPAGGTGVYLADDMGVFAFTNNGCVKGGAGGVGGFREGAGGSAYYQKNSATAPPGGTGSFENGASGTRDLLLYLKGKVPAYYDAQCTYMRDGNGQCVVTLTKDLTCPFTIRDDCGPLTINLNGHALTGYRTSTITGVPIVSIVNGTVGAEPTAITFVGPGTVSTAASQDSTDAAVAGTAGGVAVEITSGATPGAFTVGEGVSIVGGAGGYGPVAGGMGGAAFTPGAVWTGPGTVCNGAYGGDGYATQIAQEFPGAEITPNGDGYTVRLTRDIGGVLIPANRSPFVIDLNGFSIVGAAGTLAETEGEHAITVLNTACGEDFSLTLIGAGTVVGGAGFSGDSSYSADEGGCGIFVDGNATRLTLAVGEGVTVQGGVGGSNLASGCDGAYGGDGVRGSGVDAFTLVNAGQIRGGVGGDGDDEGNPGGEAIDLWPSAATGDSICVTNTVTGVIQGGDGGNGRYSGDGYEAIYVGTYAAFTVENNGEIRGGSSPDAWPDPGVGAEAISGSSTYTLTGSGTVVRGTDGREDNMKPVKNAFPGATVEMLGTMGVKVTLNDDIGPCVIPDGVGVVEIDLNGHSITGLVGCASSADGAALTVRGYGEDVWCPTELMFTGSGSIVGGAGVRSTNDTEATPGGDGIYIDGSVENIFISIGADVTVSGGHGGDAIGRLNYDSADGGCAIESYASCTFIENAGDIVGGKGGDYVGTFHSGTGADGSEAIYCGGRELTIDNAGTIEGGSGGYGIAESGYANEAIDGGYSTLTVTNREDALIVGGSGGPGGEDGGDGYSAIWAQSSATVTIVNDGTLVGGEGGTAWPYPGEGAVALAVGSGANVTGSGEVVDGEFGMYDMLTPLRESFPNMRLKLDDAGGYVVKLTEDVGPVTLLDNLGPFTIDLNGHSITGNPGCVVNRGGAALVFVPGDGEGLGATQVSFTGPGAIIGACGLNQTLTDAATDGMPAFCVSNAVSYAVSVSLGDGVTATGGAGGNAFTASGVGRGSVVTDGTLTLQGTTAKGANGVVDVTELLRAAFPSATIMRNENGYLVTLAKYSDPVTLYDNMGPVTINLNGKVVSSRDATAFASAKPAILIAHLDDAGLGPTQLTFTGGGRVQGGNGAAGTAATDPTSGGAAVAVADDVQSGLSVTVETGTSLIGGNGGDADPARGGPVGVGGKAVALGVTRLGDGTFIDGRNGDCDMTAVVAASFPASATVTHVAGGGYQVVLSEDLVGGLVLPDNLGVVALDLNGHSIRGAAGTAETDGGAAITFQTTGVALLGPTELTLAGTGLVAGGDGVNGTTERAPTNGGAAVRADSDDVAAVSVTIGAGVTLRGGNGGDGQRPGDIGAGGATVVAPVVALGDAGTRIDGVDGVCDMTAALAAAFGPTVTIARQNDGSYRVTLTEDVFDIVLPENYGRITIDLNSHAIRGSDATDDDYAGDAITVSKVGVNNMPLALTFVGSGSVVGGTGCEMNTDGGYAIRVEDYVDTLSLTVGEQVTVQGGKGWSASDDSGSDYSGCGGYGIYFCDCTGTFTLVNAGMVAGGDGGDYQGVDPYGDGGDGYYGVYVYGDSPVSPNYGRQLAITNLVTGVIRGGNGGHGNDDAEDGYYGLYVEYFEQGSIVNKGVIYGGCGGEGGDYGGEGGYAVYMYDFTDLVVENTGLIHGGDGSDGISYGDYGYYALYADSIETLMIVNDGTIQGGDGGDGASEGYTAEGAIQCYSIGSLVLDNRGDILGGDGGDSTGGSGGNSYYLIYLSGISEADVRNSGLMRGGNGGDGTSGGYADYLLEAYNVDGMTFLNEGTIESGHGGMGISNGGEVYQTLYFSDVDALDFVNKGLVQGGDGGAGGESGGVHYGVVYFDVDSLDLTNEGRILGGRGGDGGTSAGSASPALDTSSVGEIVREDTSDGTIVDGVPGQISAMAPIEIACAGSAILEPTVDGYRITLTNDMYTLVLPEDLGNVTIDLNGHALRGSDATYYVEPVPALTVKQTAPSETPLALTFVGPGSVLGGGGSVKYDSGTAILVEDYVDTLSINVGEGVTVQGGKGWCASDVASSTSSGYGGYGIYYGDCTGSFSLVNAGTVAGGDGGDYLGENPNGDGGTGEFGLYVYGTADASPYYARSFAVTNLATGVIRGGDGGRGNDDAGGGYEGLYIENFAQGSIVNNGLIRGGNGGEGANYGGYGEEAFYLEDFGTLRIENFGTIHGGNGSDGYLYGYNCDDAMEIGDVNELTIVNTGLIHGGEGGDGISGGDDSYYTLSCWSIDAFTLDNRGEIIGGNGGDSSEGSAGSAYYVLDISGVDTMNFFNSGAIRCGDGGDGATYGGYGDNAVYLERINALSFTNTVTGTIAGGMGGIGGIKGGAAYQGVYLSAITNLVFVNAGAISSGSAGVGGETGGDAYAACWLTNIVTLAVFENTGTITGGNGGDGGAFGGKVEPALVYFADTVTQLDTDNGTVTDGHPGRVDLTDLLRSRFEGTATVARDDAGYCVTLTNDVSGTVSLPPHLGELTIDLNGHSARGSNATAEDDATSALVFSLAENDAPFVLKLVGTGTVVGGSGQEGLDGSDGTSAIEVGGAGVMSVVVDEGATVQGGKGADAPMVPGRGAPAIGVGTSATFEGCTGAGVVVAGADGRRDMTQLFALLCPEAEASCVDGVWTLKLTNDVTELVLPENCGSVTLDLNGHVVRGAAATTSTPAGDALRVQRTELADTNLVLSIVGPGSLIGGCGFDASVTYSAYKDGGAGIAVDTGVAGVSIVVGADVTVKGGNGGNSGYDVGGVHGSGVDVPIGLENVTVTGDGNVSNGQDGTFDNLGRSMSQFAYLTDLTVTSDGHGGSVLTLTADRTSLSIPDNIGPITIDLNGYSIRADVRGNAVTITDSTIPGRQTELALVGPGSVEGGDGKTYTSSSTSSSTTTAGYAISVNKNATLARLVVGEGVSVLGGEGGEFAGTSTSTTTMYGGTGGAGIYFYNCTNAFVLVNEGTISGGRGGVFKGRGSYGVGGTGGFGLYLPGTSTGSVVVSNGVNGVLSGGQGGSLARYSSSYCGKKGGTGGNAFYTSGLNSRKLVNDGLIAGGDGGNSELTSGTSSSGATALYPSSTSSYASYVNNGTIANGKAGSFSKLSSWTSIFGSSNVTWDRTNGVPRVTLAYNYAGLTIPDNIGRGIVNLNGHTIIGTSDKAAIMFSHPSSTVTTPTHLILTGMGNVTGYDNPGSTTEAAGDGGVAFSLPAGTAAVTIDVGEGVTVRGGKGGDSTVEPGQGGLAVQMASGVSATFTGVLTDGADGQLCESATELLVRSAFPTATVERNDAGGCTVTLTEDIGSVSLPDNLGPVTLDLNGHSIAATTRGTAGLTFVAKTPNETPTQLTITGEGTIVGAKGNDSNSSSAAYQGGAGISINRPNVVVTVGEDVEVRGGEGGDNTYKNRGGNGGVGVAVSAANVTLNVAGTVSGGEGGHYTGTTYNYLGGAGGSGVTVSSTVGFVLDNAGLIQGGSGSGAGTGFFANGCNTAYQGMVTLTNEANGLIRGGTSWDDGSGLNGGDGIYDNAYGSTYVNLGLIAGGDGNDGGSDGGAGGVGVHAYGSSLYPSQLLNEGTIAGGNGGFGEMFGGAGASAFTGSFYCELVNEGELMDGAFGPSTFNDAFQVQYPGIEVTMDGGALVLTLTEDLHDTLVLRPTDWGYTGSTIELDMNGHSIYGPDGTAEHPDGCPGVLCDDENFDFGPRYSGLQIYDSTESSTSVIRGGNGYPSATDEPAGNGGDGITAPNAGLKTPVVGDIDGIQIWGGNGGENTGTGDGGNGGCAIRGHPWMLQDVEFHGGDGGDAITGDGGDGGDAILGFIGESDIGGNIWLYGGKGGNSQAGDGGNGGHGQHSDPHEDNYYFTRGIFYFGGDGGSSIDGDGGNGGNGLWGFAGEWNGGTILHGGDGGTSVNGDGGNGGDGLRGDGESLGGRDDPHETTGGNGGASVNGMGGNGGNGITYIPYDDSYRKAETATTFHLQLDSEGGEGADGFFRGLGGSGVVFGDDPHQGGEELNVTSSTSSNGPDGHGLNWEYPVVGPGILDWQDLIDDPWIANTYIGETNAYMTVSIDGGEPIQVRYNDTDGTFLPEQIIFGGETDTVHHVAVQFHTSSTRITATRPTGKVKDWGFKPYDINIKVPVTHPESEPFSLSNLGTVPAAEEKGKTILCDARIDTTANLDENGRQLDSTVNPAPTKASTTGTMDYWYVAQNPRRPDDTADTLAMTAPTLSAREPTTFTVGGIEGLSKFSWEMFLKEGTGKAAIKGDLTLSVVKTLDGVVTTNTYTYTAADLENNWKGQDFTFDGPTNAMYDVTFTYTNNSDGDGQALVDNIRWNPLGASLMIVDHDDPGDGYVYLAFQPQLRDTRRTSANVWVQRLIAHGLRAKRGASRAQMEKFAPAEVTFSDRADHQAATDRVWVKVPLAELEQNKGYWRVAVDDAELSFKDFDSTLVDPPAIRSSSSEKDARSVNVFGILKVMSANTNTLVAIPWTWYSAQEKNAADIPVNKLVKTTNLTDGDWLYSHLTDADGNGHYAAWMVQGGRWKAITTVMREGGDDGAGSVMRVGDDSVSIPRGNGVWLVRQRPFEVVNNVTNPIPFWVYGQSVTNAVETEVRPGPGGTYADGSVKAYSTVLGNPYGEATRVNDLQFVGEILGGGVQGDCIVVPSGTSAEKRLYRGLGPQPDKWCWTEMKLVKGRPKTTYDYDVTVPPGLAFWYERRGSGALKVVWPYKPEVPETEGN